MKHSSYLALAAIGILLSPLVAHTAENQWYDEGNNSDWLRNSWAQSSENRRRIAELPDTAVASISMPILFGIGLQDFSPNFGDPRSGGRTHEGEDIMALKGTPIISPTEAVVLRTGEGPSEGLYVYTANPGGETFVYMHLDRIGEGVDQGDVLEKGDLIGYVGNTGNASDGGAHLHFEIHDKSGNPTDPFPRITNELSLNEKIQYTAKILAQTSNPTALAQFLVTNFRSTFVSVKAALITLPQIITETLGTVILPTTNLSQGSSGTDVRTLQNYLIEANIGAAARTLASTGATGYFGALTRAALVEYQRSIGVSATGIYDAATRSRVTTSPAVATTQPTTTVPTISISYTFNRDLVKNTSHEDVRMLQKILNARGYAVATTGAGSPGSETAYFGLATEAAVKRFQAAQGISPTGIVSSLTRLALNSLK